mmetsp:Transcript_5008/g.12906  ORF Transcript_5008/g.12906 Transcript_5008/m.12906 type:complete len:829 (+) Transcript_5008:114-2600(+)
MPIPIFAPYEWHETESHVTVHARIHGATPANTDFFCSPHYVKANCKQPGGALHLLEIDLFGEVDARRSAASVRTGEVEVRLEKVTTGLWGQLVVQAVDKTERLRRRQRSIEAAERQASADAEAKKKQAWEASRHTLNSQMEMERAYRGVLEQRKAAEKAREDAELDAWQSAHEEARLRELRARFGAEVSHAADARRGAAPPTTTAVGLATGAQLAAGSGRTGSGGAPPKPLPPVRAQTRIATKFTPKMTAAPLRTKGKDADYDPEPVTLESPGLGPSRATTLRSGDLYDISHRDPAWLKDRADRYYFLRDFRAAANAYSAVLAQFPEKIPAQAVDTYLACLSNRAACHLHLDELIDAAADATHALSLAENGKSISNVPLSDDELRSRARTRKLRLLSRRGAALCHMGALEQAIDDFELAASDYASDASARDALRADADAMRARLARLRELKTSADELAKQAAGAAAADAREEPTSSAQRAAALASEALGRYSEALALGPMHIPTLANAAAAALAAHAHARCVTLCDTALRVADAQAVDSQLCPLRTRLKLLLRRATAKCELGNWHSAHADLKRATAFAPSDNDIAAQLRAVTEAARARGIELGDDRSAAAATPSAAIAAHDLDTPDALNGVPEVTGEVAAAPAAAPPPDGGAVQDALPGAPPDGAAHELSPSQLKELADASFRAGDAARAIALYTRALAADAELEWQLLDTSSTEAAEPNSTAVGSNGGVLFRCSCLANRAACHLKQSDFPRVVDDCTAAIAAVRASAGQDSEDALKGMLLKLLMRRAAAYWQLGRVDDARAEYDEAHALAPENEQVLAAREALRGAA